MTGGLGGMAHLPQLSFNTTPKLPQETVGGTPAFSSAAD